MPRVGGGRGRTARQCVPSGGAGGSAPRKLWSAPTGARGGWGDGSRRPPDPIFPPPRPGGACKARAGGWGAGRGQRARATIHASLSFPTSLHFSLPPPPPPASSSPPTPRDFSPTHPHSRPAAACAPPPPSHHRFPPLRARHSHTSTRNPHHLIGANNPSTKQNFQYHPPPPSNSRTPSRSTPR